MSEGKQHFWRQDFGVLASPNRSNAYKIPIKIDSEMWIPRLRNTAHSCSQHRPGTPWLTTKWPGNVMPLPETFILRWEYIFYRNVMLGPIVTPLRQSIMQESLYIGFYFDPLFKSN